MGESNERNAMETARAQAALDGPRYRVEVEGGGSFVYDIVDVGRFAMRMATEDDSRFFSIVRDDICPTCGGTGPDVWRNVGDYGGGPSEADCGDEWHDRFDGELRDLLDDPRSEERAA